MFDSIFLLDFIAARISRAAILMFLHAKHYLFILCGNGHFVAAFDLA